MKTLTVLHETRYRYRRPVGFTPHRLMLRPRDSHDLRLVAASLTLAPSARTRWQHDVFGNSVALVTFEGEAQELLISSHLTLQRFALEEPTFPVSPEAEEYPFVYSASDRTDLGPMLEMHHADARGTVEAWARGFARDRGTATLDLLATMNAAIRSDFRYEARDAEGTQGPAETLERGSGTCRDFALLLIEGARALGFGARFVTGYLYDPKLDRGVVGRAGDPTVGAGATHAWADIYLPGAGWVEYDPTNGLIANENLIRVAVTREPSQALPVSGGYTGGADDFASLDVRVEVREEAAPDEVEVEAPKAA